MWVSRGSELRRRPGLDMLQNKLIIWIWGDRMSCTTSDEGVIFLIIPQVKAPYRLCISTSTLKVLIWPLICCASFLFLRNWYKGTCTLKYCISPASCHGIVHPAISTLYQLVLLRVLTRPELLERGVGNCLAVTGVVCIDQVVPLHKRANIYDTGSAAFSIQPCMQGDLLTKPHFLHIQ